MESRKAGKSAGRLKDASGANSAKPGEQSLAVTDFGRIASFALPPGWVKADENGADPNRATSFHPEGKATIQIVVSRREQRLSESCSDAFRLLIDSAPNDRNGSTFDAQMMQHPPLNELMSGEGDAGAFQVLSAKTQKIHAEPALVVDGKYTDRDVNARFMYFDAERTNRDSVNAPVQEIAIIAPAKEFYKAAITATTQLAKIKWKK